MARVFSSAPLSISVETGGVQPSLSLSGQADRSNICSVVSVLDRLADEHDHCVSLDMAGVVSMDTAAIEGIAASANVFKARQKRLHLKNASEHVHYILDRLLLEDLFCAEQHCIGECNPKTCGIASKEWDIDVFSLPCDMSQCKQTRKRVDMVAENVGFPMCRREDIKLAVGEAVTNAVRYGGESDPENYFTVSCLATREKLSVSISDTGPGFTPEHMPTLEDALMSEHGRGILCMHAVMDEVSFHFDGGTTVRMVKYGE